MPQTLPASLRALFNTGVALIRRSSSGRVGLARAADVVDPELLPGVLRDRLPAALRAAYDATAEPLDGKRVAKTLGKLLDGFDPAPLAVRPTAQVHSGELDGEAVAVKLLRPGLSSTVRSDLALLDALAGPLGAAFPALDVGAALSEAREALQDELDLEHEGASQRRAGRVLRSVDGVTVPRVVGELTGEEVLVSGRLDGPTLAEAEPDDPAAVARTLVAAHVVAWREGGLILTDPRPGHVVLLRGGGIGLLGTGVSRPGDRDRLDAFLDAMVALTDDDADAFAAIVVERLALLPSQDDALAAHALLRDILGPLADGEATLDHAALAAAGERALDRIADAVALAGRATPQPADLPAARMLGQLAALLAGLGATENWAALARAAG